MRIVYLNPVPKVTVVSGEARQTIYCRNYVLKHTACISFHRDFPAGEFREIQETSRRENFPGRIVGNPGNFPGGKISICVLYNNMLYFSINTLSKRVL